MDRSRGQLHVIATTDDETRAALAEARRLAAGDEPSRVVLLVPHLVSFTAPFDASHDTPMHITERYRALASEAGLDVTVRLCFCRQRDDAFRWLLGERALVVVGCRRRAWWPTAAERLAWRLIRDGHEVVFADSGRNPAPHTFGDGPERASLLGRLREHAQAPERRSE